MKVANTLTRGQIRTRNIKADTVQTRGAMSRLNKTIAVADTDSLEGDEFGGRGKARRDAKAKAKIKKKAAPSRKERKGSKRAAKDTLLKGKAKKKISQGLAKETKAEQGGNSKVLDTLNNAVKTVAPMLSKSEPEAAAVADEKKSFSFTAWYMILIYLVVIGIIMYMVFKK